MNCLLEIQQDATNLTSFAQDQKTGSICGAQYIM